MSILNQKCVAIIGAGISGLVTAVHMLQAGIKPTIYERARDIGGMWNDDVKPCWNSMRANLSKFTLSLSNLPWATDAHIFPTQREVFHYLKQYADQFLPSDVYSFNTEVINISSTCDDNNNIHWIVEYRTSIGKIMSARFDYVVVTTGFFESPYVPQEFLLFSHKILHSSEYRSSDEVRGKNVVIVGASLSAAEIAADMATTALHIVHVASRNFWTIPRFLPTKPDSPSSPFLPVDFVFYRRSARDSADEVLFRQSKDYQKSNAYFRLLTGNNQPSSHICEVNDEMPSFVGISDMYAEYTRAGRITLQHGRLKQVDEDGTLRLDNGTTLPSCDVLVLCTGYQPRLKFFSQSILEQLSYISDDIFSPIALHRRIFHPSLSGLAFVGMYRGPYWGVIELQARWVSAVFSGAQPIPSVNKQQDGIEVERRIRDQQPRPQFPHADYVGSLNELAKEIGIVPDTSIDIVLPAQYHVGGPDSGMINEVNSLCEEANRGRFVAGAVYRALHESTWRYEKTVTDRTEQNTSSGQAHFHLLQQKLLYTEQDTLITSRLTIAPFPIAQKYMYGYDEEKDSMTVYFIDNNSTCDSLFHTLHFQSTVTTDSQEQQQGWTAVGEFQLDHVQCNMSYLFTFAGTCLARFTINYLIKSSDTDYKLNIVFFPV